ncbi:response regulator transcription factor [Parvularcula sp. IMCC14364]|uniref:LuxR C-terminal-related transcriptional regulator n=1 Tax=Parvularcula sp. IMCC14364 TaxID=3067902 RepID=UPI002742075D|nr:response regulator transcription factor [Parvularcula sp. IMCC14364]
MSDDPGKIKTILIEDVPAARAAFTEVIDLHPRLHLVEAAASWAEGKKALEQDYDLLITDLDLGDGTGLDFVKQASASGDKKVIVITVLGDVKSVMASVEAGADGYVLKSAQPEELKSAITTVLEGGAPISAAVAGHLLKKIRSENTPQAIEGDRPATRLTSREVEILTELARGFTNKEVARQLGISPYTVAEHVKAIYRKMAVSTRSEAVSQAYREGLIR